ncbi:L-2,4-diaminobutyrate decarboxylase [Frankliniella fusca]|uniref:L-2,4-diaminobutyrate decarboxylase n=1 Tax=Frankliniella fusca TaxID=407009 RepID=A0AAE1LCF4_9NEOP|nr:L-2,4-diaminobutyrate decarboxylase [Frankliniella fusca]
MAGAMFVKTSKVGVGDAGRMARLFVALKPLYYTVAALGVVPVAFRPWSHASLRWHPLRSTLLWALCVHAVSLASLRHIWAHSSAALGGGSLFSNFSALISVVHSSHALLIAPLWCEAHRCRKLVAQARTLDSLDGEVIGACWPPLRTRAWTWFWVIAIAVVFPGSTVMWNLHLVAKPLDTIQLYAHSMANVLLGVIVSVTSLLYYVIEDVALALEERFAQRYTRYKSCGELLQYRRAWLTLRDMLQGVMFAPVTVSLSCGLLVVNAVMCLYHTLFTAMVGVPPFVVVGMLVVTSMQLFILFTMCNSADGAVHAVSLANTEATTRLCAVLFRDGTCQSMSAPEKWIPAATI